MGKEGWFTTVGTGERLVGAISTGQVGNALLAVIVTAGEDLGLLIVVMANSTCYFLL